MITKLPANPFGVLQTFLKGFYLKINEIIDFVNGGSGIQLELAVALAGDEGSYIVPLTVGKIPKLVELGTTGNGEVSVFAETQIFINPIFVTPITVFSTNNFSIVGGSSLFVKSGGSLSGAVICDCVSDGNATGFQIKNVIITAAQITFDIDKGNGSAFLPCIVGFSITY